MRGMMRKFVSQLGMRLGKASEVIATCVLNTFPRPAFRHSYLALAN